MPDRNPSDDGSVPAPGDGGGNGTGDAASAAAAADEAAFLERVMRYLDDDLPKEEVLKLGQELAVDAGKRDTFVRVSLTSAVAHTELRGVDANRLLGGASPLSLAAPVGGPLARRDDAAAEAMASEIIFFPPRQRSLADRAEGMGLNIPSTAPAPPGRRGRRTFVFLSAALVLLIAGAVIGWRLTTRPHLPSPQPALPGPPALPTPLAFFDFAEPDGIRARDSGSGLLSHGALRGGFERVVDPVMGPAVRFDGTSGFVDLASPAKLNFVGSITLCAWIKPERTSGYQNIVTLGAMSGQPGSEIYLRISHGRYEAGMFGSPNLVNNIDTRGVVGVWIDPAELGTWVHLAAVHDGTSWRLYHNGRLAAVQPSPYGTVRAPSRWRIGAAPNPPPIKFFAGTITKVGIYHVALSDAQVAELARPPVQPSTAQSTSPR